jgi:fatty acid desaturase
MPSLAKVFGSLFAAVVVSLVFLLWIGWPGFLAVGTGAVFGVAFLIVATALGDDPSAADEAWRAQAADLLGSVAVEAPDDTSAAPDGAGPGPERPP